MFRELLALFRSGEPLSELSEDFSEMLRLSLDLVKRGGQAYFRHSITPEEHEELNRQDTKVNRLQRRIRKHIVISLSVDMQFSSRVNAMELPYCLLLMSLVKDVERIGDYSKDLVDLVALSDELPAGEHFSRLAALRDSIEAKFEAACEVFEASDQERAISLIRGGRELASDCERIIQAVARASYPAGAAVKLALGARFYQRIIEHVLNLLSSVVMPLHKLDYYDERDIEKALQAD